MKNINKYFKLTILSLFVVTACEEDYLPQPNDADITVAYISELQNTNTLRFSVNDNGGETSITPRLSKLASGKASFSIQANQQVLDEYNKKNGTKYEMLPENAFNFVNASTGEKGKTINIQLADKEFSSKIRVEVGEMLDASGNKLPVAKSYAIPVLMTNVDANRYVNTNEGKSGVLLLDREFTTGVLRLHGAIGIKMIDEANDKKFDNWTAQISFKVNGNGGVIAENTGLIYPNPRNSSNGQFYETLYGNGLTLFTTAGGKVGLNQPSFENFKFEPNKWYHLSIAFKIENDIPLFNLYINGELAYNGPWTGKVDDWAITYLGNSSFNGYIREFRFWDRALTKSEINSTLYFADPNAEGLQFYFPLNEDTQFENVATKTKGMYTHILTSGATEDNVNFDTKATFP